MKSTLQSFAAAALLGNTSFALPAFAEGASADVTGAYQYDGGRARILASNNLRIWSQSVPSAACRLAIENGGEVANGNLIDAMARFDETLDALEFGNAGLGIPTAEARRKTLGYIGELRTAWTPLRNAANEMTAGDASKQNLEILLGLDVAVLTAAEKLLGVVTGQYANPAEMVAADAFLIEIAERQLMLAEEMSKEACMISAKLGSAATVELLEYSIQSFDTSLQALLNGMPAAGVRPPPTSEISDGLGEVAAIWTTVKPLLEQSASEDDLSSEIVAQKNAEMIALKAAMRRVVGLYLNEFVGV